MKFEVKNLFRITLMVFGLSALGACILMLTRPSRGVNAQSSTFLVQAITNSSGCTVGGSFGSQCNITINWPTPFADTNYAAVCTSASTDFSGGGNASYDVVIPMGSTFRTTTASTVVVRNLLNVQRNIIAQSFQCVGVHN